ncbi:MAG: RDD family protein [Planctomycetes bacterium]|nr:RDD family protein [Planctomycetota bacterium]
MDPRLHLLILASERKRRIALWLTGTAIGLLSMALLFNLSVESYSAPVICADGDRLTLVYQVDTLNAPSSHLAIKERIQGGGWDASTRWQSGLTAAARSGDVLIHFNGGEATWLEGGKRVETRVLGDYSVQAAVLPGIESGGKIWGIAVRPNQELRVIEIDPRTRSVESLGASFPVAGGVTQLDAAPQRGGVLVSWREERDGQAGDDVRFVRFADGGWEKAGDLQASGLAAYALAGRDEEAWWFALSKDYRQDGEIVGLYRHRDATGWKEAVPARMKSPSWTAGGINGLCLSPEGDRVRLVLARFGVLHEIHLPGVPRGPLSLGLLAECGDLPMDERMKVWLWGGALLAIALGLTTVGGAMLWERIKARQALEAALLERIRQKKQNALRRRSVSEATLAAKDPPVTVNSLESIGLAALPALSYAALWQRALALALDSVLLLPLCVPLFQYWGVDPRTVSEMDDPRARMLLGSMSGVVFLYYVICEWRWGQSFGKYAVGIKVVRYDGEPIGFGESVARNALRLLSMFLPFLILDVASIMVTRRSQRIGDLAAGTIVIRRPPAPEEPPEDEF